MPHTITPDDTIIDNWAVLVRNMLFNLGFGYAWKQPGDNRVLQIGHILLVYSNRDYVIKASNNGLLQ